MLSEVRERPRRVAVGEFDGVHLGHREVIRGSDTVLTFEPHPLRVVRPEAAPKLLTSLEAKAELIGELGVEELVVIPFDQGFAHQSPQEFIDHILVERLAGDARVGGGELPLRPSRGRRPGDAARPTGGSRRAWCRWSRSRERSSPPATSAVWSWPARSRSRRRFLGAPFQLRGEVVTGDQRGRTLGFPTANLVPDEALRMPRPRHLRRPHRRRPAPRSAIGVRPTFGTGRALLVEAYLLDCDGDLYGSELRIDFLVAAARRAPVRLAEALIEQMRLDVDRTRELCRGSDQP